MYIKDNIVRDKLHSYAGSPGLPVLSAKPKTFPSGAFHFGSYYSAKIGSKLPAPRITAPVAARHRQVLRKDVFRRS